MPFRKKWRLITWRMRAPFLFGPERVLDRCDKCLMALQLPGEGLVLPWYTKGPVRPDQRNTCGFDFDAGTREIGKSQPDLPSAGQFDIELRQQFGIEQRAMFGAMAAVYAVTGAQGVKRELCARVSGAGNGDGIDHPAHIDCCPATALQFHVEKAEVETGIVRDERTVAEKFKQGIGLTGKKWFVRKEFVRKPMYRFSRRRHRTFGVEIAVEGCAGHYPPVHFDAPDLDHPVSGQRVETGGFGIENNLSHSIDSYRPNYASLQGLRAVF